MNATTPYQQSLENLDRSINIFGVVLNDYFGEFYKVASRSGVNGHATAHCYWRSTAGAVPAYARVTNSCEWRKNGFDDEGSAIWDIHVNLDLNDDRYRIIGTVDYLLMVYSDRESTIKEGVKIVLVDSKTLYTTIRLYQSAGNEALNLKGLPVLKGWLSVPLSQLVEWDLVKATFQFVPGDAVYYAGTTERNIDKLKAGVWGAALRSSHLASTIVKESHPVVLVNKSGVMGSYESISKAAFGVWGEEALTVVRPNGTRILDNNALLGCIAKLSQVVNKIAKKTKGPDGEWFTVFDAKEWAEMIDSEKRDALLHRLLKKSELKQRAS